MGRATIVVEWDGEAPAVPSVVQGACDRMMAALLVTEGAIDPSIDVTLDGVEFDVVPT